MIHGLLPYWREQVLFADLRMRHKWWFVLNYGFTLSAKGCCGRFRYKAFMRTTLVTGRLESPDQGKIKAGTLLTAPSPRLCQLLVTVVGERTVPSRLRAIAVSVLTCASVRCVLFVISTMFSKFWNCNLAMALEEEEKQKTLRKSINY